MSFKFLFFGLVIFCAGCVQKDSLQVCPAVVCATDYKQIELEFLDQTGFNLFVGKTSLSALDIKVYSNRLKKYVETEVDNSGKFIMFSTYGSDDFDISYNNLKPDILKLETKFNPDDCCGVLDITKLTLNNTILTFNNASPTIITLKK
jgi:hypothetical protein